MVFFPSRSLKFDCIRYTIIGRGREGKGREGKGREGKGRERKVYLNVSGWDQF
jgi:hypothetical protein